MKCPVCGHENEDTFKFCMKCGTQIPGCPTCGRVLTSRDRFCINDGTPIPEAVLSLIPEEVELVTVMPAEDPVDEVVAAVQTSLDDTYAQPVHGGFCINCGAPVPAGQDFCDTCLLEVPEDESAEFVERPVRRKKKKTGLIVALILILLVLVGSIAAVSILSGEDFSLGFLTSGREDADDRKDKEEEDEEEDQGVEEEEDSTAGENAEDSETTESQEMEGETTAPTTEAPTEEPTEAPTEEIQPEDDPLLYFIEHCDDQYFTEADLEGFDAEMCRYARNACYAHSGRMFNDQQLQAYYEQFDWYEPIYTPDNFPTDILNDYQRQNIAMVSAYETEMGYR